MLMERTNYACIKVGYPGKPGTEVTNQLAWIE